MGEFQMKLENKRHGTGENDESEVPLASPVVSRIPILALYYELQRRSGLFLSIVILHVYFYRTVGKIFLQAYLLSSF